MAERASPGLSRIPVSMKSPPTNRTKREVDNGENIPPSKQLKSVIHIGHKKENGNSNKEKIPSSPVTQRTGKGFNETYLMTGSRMIIKTTPSPFPDNTGHRDEGVSTANNTDSYIPKFEHGAASRRLPQSPKVCKYQASQAILSSPKISSRIPAPVKAQHNQDSGSPSLCRKPQDISQIEPIDFPIVAPVAEMEELSDLSQSSCSESEMGLEKDLYSSVPRSCLPSEHGHTPSMLDHNLSNLQARRFDADEVVNHTEGLSDTSNSFPEPLSSGDSGFVHDGHTSDSELHEKSYGVGYDRCISDDETTGDREDSSERSSSTTCSAKHNPLRNQNMIASSSGEKFMLEGGDRPLVRTSKSHENYLQGGNGLSLVNIDIDMEDGLAYSLDTLTYPASSDSSLEKVPQPDSSHVSRSLHNSPERRSEKICNSDRDYMPGFISLEDSKQIKLKLNKQREEQMMDTLSESSTEYSKYEDQIRNQSDNSNNSPNQSNGWSSSHHHALDAETEDHFTERISPSGGHNQSGGEYRDNMSVLSDDSDSDSIYHQPSKSVDRPSALRLAKRLYHLTGFRKSDVSRHLYKKNDFSTLVAEEYLKFFDFSEDTLDSALRKFLGQFSLYGETQERERVLAHFSQRFMECNPGSFNSDDACHTLTCAIMLLHSDLHSKNVRRRMTCQEFIENLNELNDGDNFPKEVLKAIYLAIKTGSIQWAVDEEPPEPEAPADGQAPAAATPPVTMVVGSNPFLEVPDPSKATEYKKGYVMRKSCMEPEKRKTPMGKRGWKMVYAVLKDLILYQYKDEHHEHKGQFVQSSHNAIRIHHAVAAKASDYTKKQHVFRLVTADWAEFLFQTGNPNELQEWVETINSVAASLSAPPLPGAVGSRTKFTRPLLPSTFTKLNLKEQLKSHEAKLAEVDTELAEHRMYIPEKGAKASVVNDYADKEIFLEHEMKRFKIYVDLLQAKLSVLPDPEQPSLTETSIGENEEVTPGPGQIPSQPGMAEIGLQPGPPGNPVQRSLSDRYSYRAAIYQNDAVEYDMV